METEHLNELFHSLSPSAIAGIRIEKYAAVDENHLATYIEQHETKSILYVKL